MENFEYFNTNLLNQYLVLRNNETKFGEKIKFPSNSTDLQQFIKETKATYVVFGVKEFAGIKANFGKIGTKHSWEIFLSSFLNIQHNKYLKASNVAIIGCLNFTKYDDELNQLNPNIPHQLNRLYKIVEEIDKEVTYLNTIIHQAGKKSIIIGGGHNNAYGNIKGLALAKGAAVNVVNFDAHTDFRTLEGRHSGNGFSYAFNEGFVKTYYAFGVHENYINKYMWQQFKEHTDRLKLYTFEEMKIRYEKTFLSSAQTVFKEVKNRPYGVEIDLDAIENIASSAMSPSGFTVTEARQFVSLMANHSNASYLHICEGSASLTSSPENILGKLITYLVTDFIKSQIVLTK